MAAVQTQFGIPVRSNSVNLIDVHPELRARVRAALWDPRLLDSANKPRCHVVSGARTKAHQQRLYDQWIAYKNNRGPKANLAANPNYCSPYSLRCGSAHMVQTRFEYQHGNLSNMEDWAYAVDISFAGTYDTRLLIEVCRFHDLDPSVLSAGEWWHYVPTLDKNLRSIVGRGSANSHVSDLQRDLTRTYWPGTDDVFLQGSIDGIYGPITQAAVENFQKTYKLWVTGDWTVTDDRKLDQVMQRQSDNREKRKKVKNPLTKNEIKQIVRIIAAEYQNPEKSEVRRQARKILKLK